MIHTTITTPPHPQTPPARAPGFEQRELTTAEKLHLFALIECRCSHNAPKCARCEWLMWARTL